MKRIASRSGSGSNAGLSNGDANKKEDNIIISKGHYRSIECHNLYQDELQKPQTNVNSFSEDSRRKQLENKYKLNEGFQPPLYEQYDPKIKRRSSMEVIRSNDENMGPSNITINKYAV